MGRFSLTEPGKSASTLILATCALQSAQTISALKADRTGGHPVGDVIRLPALATRRRPRTEGAVGGLPGRRRGYQLARESNRGIGRSKWSGPSTFSVFSLADRDTGSVVESRWPSILQASARPRRQVGHRPDTPELLWGFRTVDNGQRRGWSVRHLEQQWPTAKVRARTPPVVADADRDRLADRVSCLRNT